MIEEVLFGNKPWHIEPGNCLDALRLLPDESIDCVLTSPPYWGLRDYGTEPQVWDGDATCDHEWRQTHPQVQSYFCTHCNAWLGELGLEPNPSLYVDHLLVIFREVKRVLKATGTCWVVLGDTYWTAKGSCNNPGGGKRSLEKRLKEAGCYPLHRGNKSDCNISPKSLCCVPSRFVVGMVDDGWICRNEILWNKTNCTPSSAKDRFTVDFEKVFFFTKSRKYHFTQQFEPLRDPARLKHRQFNPDNKRRKVTRNQDGTGASCVNPKTIDASFKRILARGTRNKRCVWQIGVRPLKAAHYAPFPLQLIETPIKAGCPEGGVVLDPFAGAGTTIIAALNHGCRAIGIELNPDYVELAQERIVRECE